jgi:hypothetical protein
VAVTVNEGDVPCVPKGGVPETTPAPLIDSHPGAPDKPQLTSEEQLLTVAL